MAIDIMSCYREAPQPQDPVLPGLLPGRVGSIVSPGGAGKSMMCLQLAHHVGGGVDTLGLGTYSTGRVVYLSGEDSEDVLHARLHAIGSRLDTSQREACAGGMLIEDLTKHTPDLFDQRWKDAIERLMEGSRLLFLDTLRSFHAEDENDNTRMSVLVGWLRSRAARHNCAVVFLHHSSKAAAMNGQGDAQQAARGASVLTDNIRWQSYLTAMTKEEADELSSNGSDPIGPDQRGYYVRFGISKQNHGAPFPERWFRRAEGGVLQPVQLTAIGGRRRRAF